MKKKCDNKGIGAVLIQSKPESLQLTEIKAHDGINFYFSLLVAEAMDVFATPILEACNYQMTPQNDV